MTILDRYLVKEFLLFFLAVIVGFLVLMTGNTVFIMSDLIMGKRIPFWIVSQILLLRMPAMMVLGFPAATIFGVFLTMGRLGKDSELVAMRTGGVSFQRIILPVLGMAGVVSIGSFWMNEVVVPEANHISQNYIRQFYLTEVMEKAEARVFFRIPGDMVIYASEFDPKQSGLEEVFLFELDPQDFPEVTLARNGAMDARSLILHDGTKFEFSPAGDVERNTNFGALTTDISREVHKLFGQQRTPQEMTSSQLKGHLEDFEERRFDVKVQKTDYYFKFSIPVANLAFAMVGLLFVVSTPRKENYSGILVGLVLILIYWVLMTLSRSMGHKGILSPMMAAWSQNIIYFIIGLPMLFLARR